ncbi:hypothetical protein [Ancylobacter sp. IITR112]|uniref:hypothetical protein n=1 Tax=Ancylobacter sp. IITR112 TaxID=3138073 RepID=UPI00352A898D
MSPIRPAGTVAARLAALAGSSEIRWSIALLDGAGAGLWRMPELRLSGIPAVPCRRPCASLPLDNSAAARRRR